MSPIAVRKTHKRLNRFHAEHTRGRATLHRQVAGKIASNECARAAHFFFLFLLALLSRVVFFVAPSRSQFLLHYPRPNFVFLNFPPQCHQRRRLCSDRFFLIFYFILRGSFIANDESVSIDKLDYHGSRLLFFSSLYAFRIRADTQPPSNAIRLKRSSSLALLIAKILNRTRMNHMNIQFAE